MQSCINQNKSIASKLLEQSDGRKIDINVTDNSDRTALHIACQSGLLDIMKKLLEQGANIEALDSSKRSPLANAIYTNREAVVQLLLDRGASVKNLITNSPEVLVYPIATNNSSMLKQLLRDGIDVNQLAPETQHLLFSSALSQQYARPGSPSSRISTMKILVENGFDPNRKFASGAVAGALPVDLAVRSERVAMVEYLSEITDLTKSKSKPEFLIEWACSNDAEKLAGKLLELEPAIANSTLPNGRSALATAAESGYTRMVKKLIASDANVNAYFKDGNSPLLLASAAGHGEMVEVLLKAGADVNAADETGQSALHLACGSSSEQVVSALIAAGANVNAVTKTKKTPLHVAAWIGATECVKAILNAKSGTVNIDVQDSDGWTPLHKAAFRGHVVVVSKLVQKGADKTIKTIAGMTALQLAEGKKRQKDR